MRSKFKSDLSREKELAVFLDQLYQKHLRRYSFKRISNRKAQLLGTDVVLTHKQSQISYVVDEKDGEQKV